MSASNQPRGAALSSNWQALQETLKRKSPADEDSPKKGIPPVEYSIKRIRPSVSNDRRTMNFLPPKGLSNGGKLILKTTTVAKTHKTPETLTSTTLQSRKATIAWAKENDLDPEVVAQAYATSPTQTLPAESGVGAKSAEAGRYVAIDCEMVGVGGKENERSALARVSLVNYHGHCVLDTFVRPKERVTDWRTWVSGVSPKDMVNAVELEVAQQKVHDLVNGRILIGHAIHHDLEALFLSHPKRDIRDTSKHQQFRKLAKQKTPGLRRLAKEILGLDIQSGAHSSVEDARVTMLLYRKHKAEFEQFVAEKYGRQQQQKPRPKGSGKKRKNKQTSSKQRADGDTEGDVDGTDVENGSEDEDPAQDDFDDWLA